MAERKEYFAFISYKREDERWAKWLQHKLEHYHLPTNVRKDNPSLPQSIRPVFKDTSELAAGVLADEIHEALDNSKYLVVICSPRAAQSKWVGKEVQTFIDMGRSDKIIPFIIGGKPFSENPEEECFPSALLNLPKEQELLGVNINEMGRDAAVVKVVARMFGLKFDALWQRYEREQKRKRWMWIAGAILLALLGLSIGGYFVMQNGIIERQKKGLEDAASHLREDSVTLANHILRIQNDSVLLSLQKDSIQKTNMLLEATNADLTKANLDLRDANFRIVQERNGMLAAQSRAVAEKAKELIDGGHTALAARLLLEVLPDVNRQNSRPYVVEAELELRRVLDKITSDNYYSLFPVNSMLGKDVVAASFTIDDNTLVTTSGDGLISFWNVSTGRRTDTLAIDANNLAFNTHGSKLAVVGENSLYIYDAITHKLLKTLHQPSKILLSEFSKDGNILVTKHLENLQVYDIGNERHLFSIPEKYDKFSMGVDQIAISQNNRIVAISKWIHESGILSYYIDLWDIQKNERLMSKKVDKNVRSIIFTPNSKYLLFAYNLYGKDEEGFDIIYVLNVQDGIIDEGFKGVSYGTGMMNYNNDGTWLSTTSVENGTFRLWDLKSKSLLASIDGAYQHYRPVVSNDGKSFVSKNLLWRFNDKTIRHKELSYAGFKFCKAGNYVFVNEEDSCYSCYDCDTWKLICKSYSNAGCSGLDATCNYTLVKENGGSVTIRDSHNGNIVSSFLAHTNKMVFPATISSDEKYVYSGDNLSGDIIKWNLNSGRKLQIVYHFDLEKEDLIRDIVCHPNGTDLIVSTDRFNVYNIDTKNHSIKLIGKHSKLISSLSLCPQGCHVITSSMDQSAVIWDMNGTEIRRFYSLKGFSNADLSLNHKLLITVSEEGNSSLSSDYEEDLKIWNVKTGKVLYIGKTFTDAVFASENKYLTNYDGDLWEFSFLPLEEVMNRVRKLIFDPSLTEEEKQRYYLK